VVPRVRDRRKNTNGVQAHREDLDAVKDAT
jgi:hypothetical protein